VERFARVKQGYGMKEVWSESVVMTVKVCDGIPKVSLGHFSKLEYRRTQFDRRTEPFSFCPTRCHVSVGAFGVLLASLPSASVNTLPTKESQARNSSAF